ncbi:hypothetical protein [Blattabacterium cuenoti]|uniref:hypothetical protein n=1 Tax=Blattabacterium cuenoti TaxID=1653831 RepID=UPI00163CAB7B|nr:hypothetical protein [Blattabacterium cuenoti]
MSIRIKLIIFIILFLLSIFLFFIKKNYFLGTISILISLITIFFIFRNEFLLIAIIKVGKKDMKGLKKYLGYIKNPKLQLIKQQIAYFYFLNGILFLEKNMNKSEFYMKKALYCGLKFKQNIAIAKLNLAIISLSKGDKKQAENLLSEAKKMDVSGILQNQIQIIKKQIKKINTSNIQNTFFRKKL